MHSSFSIPIRLLSPLGLAEGERCDNDGGDAGDEDEDDDDDDTEEDSSDASSGRKRNKRKARRRITGANDRHIFGQLSEATPPCGDGLLCIRVALGRRECRPENTTGEKIKLLPVAFSKV